MISVNSEINAHILHLLLILAEERKYEKYPAGTIVDGKNVGGQFAPTDKAGSTKNSQEGENNNLNSKPSPLDDIKKLIGDALEGIDNTRKAFIANTLDSELVQSSIKTVAKYLGDATTATVDTFNAIVKKSQETGEAFKQEVLNNVDEEHLLLQI